MAAGEVGQETEDLVPTDLLEGIPVSFPLLTLPAWIQVLQVPEAGVTPPICAKPWGMTLGAPVSRSTINYPNGW